MHLSLKYAGIMSQWDTQILIEFIEVDTCSQYLRTSRAICIDSYGVQSMWLSSNQSSLSCDPGLTVTETYNCGVRKLQHSVRKCYTASLCNKIPPDMWFCLNHHEGRVSIKRCDLSLFMLGYVSIVCFMTYPATSVLT